MGYRRWDQFYEVPQDNDYKTYTVPLPGGALTVSPLRTKVRVKNGGFSCGGCPLQSGEYFEGVVIWNPTCLPPDTIVVCPPDPFCEGTFRAGHECDKATDGDWNTSAVPDAYCDSVSVIQEHSIPPGTTSADWVYKVLRNTSCIEVRAFYWDYATTSWTQFDVVTQNNDYMTDTVHIPPGALAVSPLRTKVRVKNGGGACGCPLQSGEFFEGVVRWDPTCPSCPLVTACGRDKQDVDNSGAVDVIDVTKVIGVAFRGQPATPDSCNSVSAP